MGMAPTKSFEELAKEQTAPPAENITPTTPPAEEKKDGCCGACKKEEK